MRNRVTARVDLDIIRQNYNYISSLTGKSRVMAVVKADAYGHGAIPVAKTLSGCGCTDFAVACISEAQELRNAGIAENILILGPTAPAFAPEVAEGDFIQACDSFQYAKELNEKGKLKVHLKIDTGMSRIGIYCHSNDDIENAVAEIERISLLENISIEGIFTHFADSDGCDREFTDKQFDIFKNLLNALSAKGIQVGVKHCCNSAATLRYPEMHLDMVRAGIILYGLMPSNNLADSNIAPAMSLQARVCAVHSLKKGDCVSYGCTYEAQQDTRVAVISIGYADGFSRVYSGKELIRINGKSYATVGKICMDMCMVDIGNDAPCAVGDQAVIFESSEDISRLADAMGTINYEVLCSLKHRVQLKYLNI